MADSIAEKFEGELFYETPRILEMTVPTGVVRGESGPMYGQEGSEEIPGELMPLE